MLLFSSFAGYSSPPNAAGKREKASSPVEILREENELLKNSIEEAEKTGERGYPVVFRSSSRDART